MLPWWGEEGALHGAATPSSWRLGSVGLTISQVTIIQVFCMLKQEVVDLNESSESEDREKDGEMFRCQNYRALKHVSLIGV